MNSGWISNESIFFFKSANSNISVQAYTFPYHEEWSFLPQLVLLS